VTAGEPVREECLKGSLDRFGVFVTQAGVGAAISE
jgi:hypothetical protein